MARRSLSPDDLAAIRTLAEQFGKIIGKRAFGPDGPGPEVDLTAMEEVAVEAARALTQGAVEDLLRRQAQHLPVTHPCPSCGRTATARETARPIVVRGAVIEHREPVCYCSSCRRDFFPPAGVPEARHARV